MSRTDYVLYTLENFLPWHRHLPKKILLNFVAAKASRHISCPFCPFTCTSLYHFLYCSIYYLQLNLKICDSLFQITDFVIVAFWTVVLAFFYVRLQLMNFMLPHYWAWIILHSSCYQLYCSFYCKDQSFSFSLVLSGALFLVVSGRHGPALPCPALLCPLLHC